MAQVANTTPVSAASLLVWAIILETLAGFFLVLAITQEATRSEYSDPPTAQWMMGVLLGLAALVVLCKGVYRLVIKIEDAAKGVMDHVYE